MKMLELLFIAKWELTFIDSQAFRDVHIGRALLLDQCASHTWYIAVPRLSVDRRLRLDDQYKEPMVNTEII